LILIISSRYILHNFHKTFDKILISPKSFKQIKKTIRGLEIFTIKHSIAHFFVSSRVNFKKEGF